MYSIEKFMTQVFPGYKHFKSEIEYLGLPYTDKNKFILNFRAEISNLIAVELMKQGRIIFAPISSWHPMAMKYDLPIDFEYWSRLDEEFIKVSKRLLIIQLPGWDTSKGVNLETEIANHYNIPIEYINPNNYLHDTSIMVLNFLNVGEEQHNDDIM